MRSTLAEFNSSSQQAHKVYATSHQRRYNDENNHDVASTLIRCLDAMCFIGAFDFFFKVTTSGGRQRGYLFSVKTSSSLTRD